MVSSPLIDRGWAARAVAWITGNVLGDWAVQSGWIARAGTILEEAGTDGPKRGWVLILRSYAEPDVPAREALLGEAARMMAGVTSPAELFSEQNVGRILANA
jgi:hypothetical protein